MREGKVPVALNLTRTALGGWHQEISGEKTGNIHAALSHLLQRLTEFLECLRVQGGHVTSVMAGETRYDSETMGWFSFCRARGGNKWFCRVFHIVVHP